MSVARAIAVWSCAATLLCACSGGGKGDSSGRDASVERDGGAQEQDASMAVDAGDAGPIGPVLCGNARIDADEACDDGNNRAGDGCDADCRVESGFACVVEGAACEECGNAIVESSEECDDGNGDDDDGCSSECDIEGDWVCPVAGQPCELCGNGVVEANERCDEGSFADGMGCAEDCRSIDAHFQCPTAGKACVQCGDGAVGTGEVCDDANVVSGDGCVFNCSSVEHGFRCPATGGSCTLCGDGSIDGDEECDDGNFVSDDGCTDACELEPGSTCFYPGVLCSKCGNGFIEYTQLDDKGTADTSDDVFSGLEACDDGNQADGDGCSSMCAIENDGGLPWLCPLPGLSCARCGDSVTQAIEACDDGVGGGGAPLGGDGCSADCTTIEPNYHCPPAGGTCVLCGDGVVDAPVETCDDKNVLSGDGCSRLCLLETNLPWTCPLAGQPCELCGNGVIETTELCDDGNRNDSDGCSADCKVIEADFNCFFPGFACAKCGDGVVSPGEQCDEGDLAMPSNATAGCDSSCQVVSPWSCPLPNQPCELCGDGLIGATETCEDGNVASNDGCSSTCQTEPGYDCAGGPCLAAACGDGFRAGNEECDDGNQKSGDGCSFVCQIEDGWSCAGAITCHRTTCGDGVVEGAEQCDDGNTAAADGCDGQCQFEKGYYCPTPGTACQPATCGNGVVEGYETCDDANNVMPGCDADCRLEPNYYCPTPGAACLPTVCGDGLVQGLEACDDGNVATGDGCDDKCVVETFYRCKGEPSDCGPIIEFVAIRRFNVSYVNPEAMIYDPDRRAFAAHKASASQLPVELCLDGTILNPNDDTVTAPDGTISALPQSYVPAPRPVGSGLVGAAYDPFTDDYLFLNKNGQTTTLVEVPRNVTPANLALYQVILTDTDAGALDSAELTVGEDGDLYITDYTSSSQRVLVFPRRRDVNKDIILPDCTVMMDPNNNCTSFAAQADASGSWSAPSDDVLTAIFTVPGESLVGIFNQYAGAASYAGFDEQTNTVINSSEYFTFYEPAQAADPPLYGRSQLPGLLFDLGFAGRSYGQSAKSAETAPDGGAFIICPQNPSEPCQIFARTCTSDADCADGIPGTVCGQLSDATMTTTVHFCHSPGEARDDAFTVDRNSTNQPLDVLANDSKSESACIDPNFEILAICGDGVTQAYETANPGSCPDDTLPLGNPKLTGGVVTYDAPNDGSCGFVDTFVYTVDLGGGVIDTANVRVVVACVCGDGFVDSNEQCDEAGNNAAPGFVLDDGGTPADPSDDVYARCGTDCFFNVFCGDGYIVTPEQCDDRNTANSDGCSAFCTLESVCGNGQVEGVEQCDDGNSTSGDACNANCTLPVCGDGNVDVQKGETCDDGNLVVADGCDNACHVETVCGNGLTELGEDCDDGNKVGGDGCSAKCTVENICGNDVAESGEQCDGSDYTDPLCPVISGQQVQCTNTPANSINLCVCANYCGDSMIGGLEECDAGLSGSASCRGGTPSAGMPCTIIRCGDGVKDTGEACDDGNANPSDGCTNDCKITTVCGNGTVEGTEECDDGNNISGDGCSSACKNEATVCGDGVLNFNEQCDDGNLTAGDGCSPTCLSEGGVCGNGKVDLGEQCDDGNTTSGDGCDTQCQLELCGNGVLDPGEGCDDGNKVSGDGCSAVCRQEVG